MTGQWTLVPPEGLDDLDWADAANRGVLLHAHLDHDGRRFPAIVYDRHRIVQDADHVNESGPYYDQNVIVVSEVTKESIRQAGEWLTDRGHLGWLLELGATPGSEWSLAVPNSADWSQITERGTLSASLDYGDHQFPVTFFDLQRFAAAVGWDSLDNLLHGHNEPRPVEFYEQNFIVIPTLTKETTAQAVEKLSHNHEFDWLVDGGP